MSPRRSQVVWQWRAAAHQSLKPVAAQQAGKRQQRSDDSRRDEDGVETGPGEEVGLAVPWQSDDVPDNDGETPVTEQFSRLDLTVGADDEGAAATDRLIRLYLKEAGTVPMLTAADEVRLAEQLHTAKAHLLQALQTALPAGAGAAVSQETVLQIRATEAAELRRFALAQPRETGDVKRGGGPRCRELAATEQRTLWLLATLRSFYIRYMSTPPIPTRIRSAVPFGGDMASAMVLLA